MSGGRGIETAQLLTVFPALAALGPEDLARLAGRATAVHLPPGKAVFAEGTVCEAYLMVLNGSVRVRKISEQGREIVLYRVERGQTCVLTTACLMNAGPYGAEGLTETDVDAIALPKTAFERLMDSAPAFRQFVFSAYATRVSDLLMLIEEVAFGRIDVRLAQFLLARAGNEDAIWLGTHQDLATELGSAREVISRQLKDFERRGWVLLGRGRVTLRDTGALRSLVENR